MGTTITTTTKTFIELQGIITTTTTFIELQGMGKHYKLFTR